MRKLLSPRQIARAIGTSEASLKRWVDRGLLSAVRTAGGHRKVPVSEVLRFIRGRGVALVRPEILGLPATSGRSRGSLDRGGEIVLGALRDGDQERLRAAAFDLHLAGHSLSTICDQVLAPAFRTLGQEWQHGELEVYQERRGVEICAHWLHEMSLLVPRPAEKAPYAIGGTLERDPYTLPTTMAEAVLREAGWNAESYGAGHPLKTLCAAIRTRKPRLVWISFSVLELTPGFVESWSEVYATSLSIDAALVIGGRALTEELRRTLQYSCYCTDLTHLVAFARTLNRSSTPAPPVDNTGGSARQDRS